MREIKFRAWDKLDKKMREVSAINFFDEMVTLDEQPNGDYFKRHQALVEVMQYTGLKDKNGKEIYEGDIVMFPDTESEYVDVGIGNVKVAETQLNAFFPVDYVHGEFGMYINGTELGVEGWASLRFFGEEFAAPDTWEVIGNIYENSDLLNQ